MNKLLITLVFLCLFSSVSFSQGKIITFGEIDKADLEMVVYPLDSGAEAIYLVDKAEVVFNENDLNMYMRHHVRIKILSEKGLNRADVSLNWIRGENLNRLKSATYNLENGKMVTTEISRKDWVDEKYTDKIMQKKLSFPDVKVGSVIEYKFEQNMGFFANLPGWQFQKSIPVKYSEFKVEIPKYGSYQPGFKGYVKPSYYLPSKSAYHIIIEEVPGLKKEPYVATMENFRSEIDFEIKSYNIPGRASEVFLEDWGAIAGALAGDDDYGDAINKLNRLNKIYPKDKNWGNDEESMKSIFNYVRDHFQWNEYYGFKIDATPRSIWQEAKGNDADINHMLTMFLRKAGIEANPVLISTRGNGYLKRMIPLTRQFNYVITCAKFGDKEYLLDATEKFRPYNVLPERALNGKGLHVSEERYKWIDLRTNKEMDSKTFTANIKLNDDDEIEGNVSIVARGTAASRLRESLITEGETSPDETEEESDDEGEDIDDYKVGEVEDVKVLNVDNPDKSLEVTYNFSTDTNVDFIGDKIFLNPVVIKFIEENPFKLEKRIYPVEFPAPIVNTYIFNIDIPDGFEVEELPARKNLALPEKGGRYTYLSAVQGDKIQVMIRLSLMKTTYTPKEYGALRQLFNLIVSNQQSQIVLKEKGE